MLRWITLLLFCLAATAQAAPKQVTVTYHAVRDGQPFATVTETYRQSGGRYRIESMTEGIGVYALFGKRILVSEGDVTAAGLRPARFEQRQGDNPRKTVTAVFDWQAGVLSVAYKDKQKTLTLQPRTQDILSYAYQFMFQPPKGAEVKLPVTTGRKLGEYRYLVQQRDVAVATDAGSFRTTHLVNADPADEDNKELWIGSRAPYLPVKIALTDESGARIEQTLTSLDAK